ncbi:MAG TPA: polysaccharide pyruvyl transferase family protein [Myxococcales bacterium]|nr:polysaccharide pyruvyl transferase family protein [Myxococcales bacterium]
MRLRRQAAAPAVDVIPSVPGMISSGRPSIRAAQPHPRRIAFFGNFGTQNLGNEYTLAAILANARRRMPDAELTCICTDPDDVTARHGVTAISMSYRYSSAFIAAARRMSGSRVIRAMRRLFVRIPRELAELVRAFRALRGVTTLVMTGTGMLSDVGIGPFDLHWEILKWSALAKLRGARVVFASVGAGPIASRTSRWIVKRALALADYRSYRDAWSRSYLETIGFDAAHDHVFPDLAFSLPPEVRAARSGPRRVVGVGLMDYYGTRASPRVGEEAYLAYVSKVTRFVSWLLERGYDVRLLIGDVSYDTRSKSDVLRRLRESGAPPADGRVVAAPITSGEELLAEIVRSDLVVPMRFHTALLALMLKKPVLALSYHQKCAALMKSLGLPQYSHDVDREGAEHLIEQFVELERNSATFAPFVEARAAECRRALDEQYGRIFGWPRGAAA